MTDVQRVFACGVILLFAVLLIHFLYTIYAVFKGAVYIPTSRADIKRVLKLLVPREEDRAIDLGSGDGRLVLALARAGVRECVGVEINYLLVIFSRLRVLLSRRRNVTIRHQDIWSTDLRPYSIVILFFVPIHMEKMKEKILQEMKPGSRVASVWYEIPEMELVGSEKNVYCYRV
ncbi:methyltransferase [bacterium]|nr:methyltransferase [bacterium]